MALLPHFTFLLFLSTATGAMEFHGMLHWDGGGSHFVIPGYTTVASRREMG